MAKENPNWQEDENLKEVYVKIIQNVMGDVDEEKMFSGNKQTYYYSQK